jgi:hypothetical protein
MFEKRAVPVGEKQPVHYMVDPPAPPAPTPEVVTGAKAIYDAARLIADLNAIATKAGVDVVTVARVIAAMGQS